MRRTKPKTLLDFSSEEDGANWYAYVGNDPVNFVDIWGLFSLLVGEGLTYNPDTDRYTSIDSRNTQDKSRIDISRKDQPETFSDLLELLVDDLVIVSAPIQSTANIPEPRLTDEFNGGTLPVGTYNATLLSESISYDKPIRLVDDYLIHPNEVTNMERRAELEAVEGNVGPWVNQVSAGCPVTNTDDYKLLTMTMESLGYEFNNRDRIEVNIKKNK